MKTSREPRTSPPIRELQPQTPDLTNLSHESVKTQPKIFLLTSAANPVRTQLVVKVLAYSIASTSEILIFQNGEGPYY